MSDPSDRLLDALYRFVSLRVQEKLPPHQRGLAARRVLDPVVPMETARALTALINELAVFAGDAMATEGPALTLPEFPVDYSDRLSVLDNVEPCSICGVVRRAAVLEVQAGEVASVECESCASDYQRHANKSPRES